MKPELESGSKSTTPATKMKNNPFMATVGLAIGAGLFILLAPLLPILVLIYILSKLSY